MLMQLAPYDAQCRVLRERLRANRVPHDILLVVSGLDALGYPPWAEKWVPAALAFMGVTEIDVTPEEAEQ